MILKNLKTFDKNYKCIYSLLIFYCTTAAQIIGDLNVKEGGNLNVSCLYSKPLQSHVKSVKFCLGGNCSVIAVSFFFYILNNRTNTQNW